MSDKNPTPAQRRERKQELERFGKDEYHWVAHDNGLELEEKSPHHYRFIGRGIKLDIWPGSKKYHNLKTQERGTYEDLEEFIKILTK